ncbi:MAG: hypothetical protein J6S91_12690 [Treponema sp.]|nr:hypothetical protein [Treponema sp.]
MKKSEGSVLFTTLAFIFGASVVMAGIFGLLNVRFMHAQKKAEALYENENVYGTKARQMNEAL